MNICGTKLKLLSRLVEHRIECQICVTPHVGDRKIFDWSRDLDHLFSIALSYCDSLRLLKNLPNPLRKDPYRFFGISHSLFQSRVADPPQPAPVQVTGVLLCSDGISPSLIELKTYMGLHPTRDDKHDWLIVEMLTDPLPPGYTQHVSRNSVYWTSSGSNESTWKHPHYDKYSHYIKCARISDTDNRVLFQLKNRPTDNGITSLIEVARIYGIRLLKEPFLVHALSDPDSPDSPIRNINAARSVFENISHLYHSIHIPVCSECSCVPSQFCSDCSDFFCDKCFTSIHDSGMRIEHKRTPFRSPICSECDHSISSLHCSDCNDPFCYSCFKHMHARGGRRYHVPIILVDMSSRTTSVYAQKIEEKFLTMTSPWIEYNGIYYNVAKNFESSFTPPNRPNSRICYIPLFFRHSNIILLALACMVELSGRELGLAI